MSLTKFPKKKLTQIYEFIHEFRLELSKDSDQPRTPGLLQGTLSSAFFEPLPEEELREWEKNI